MKVTPVDKTPFSERQFVVEMSGLELAVIKYLVSNCATGNSLNMGYISSEIYRKLKPFTKVDCDDFNQEIPTIPLNLITQEEFEQKINELNK